MFRTNAASAAKYLGVLAAMLTGCTLSVARDRGMFHALEFENHGKEAITEVEIRYGDYSFPTSQSVRSRMDPSSGPSELRTLPVPETVFIKWISSSGTKHSVQSPLRSHIENWKLFNGINFSFVDDRVEIYIVENVFDRGRKVDTKRTKILSLS